MAGGGDGDGELDVFDAGRCAEGYALGLAVGRRFADVIRSRMRQDVVLREQLLPFASTAAARPLLAALQAANRESYPRYWDELLGTADGSGVPLLHVILVNFRKEILPFIPKAAGGDHGREEEPDGDCSDVLLVSDAAAIAAHNEDGNAALLGHTYLAGAGDAAGRPVLHRLHLRRRAPQLRLRLQQQRSGLHARLGPTGERRDRRRRHCPELRVAGPARGEEPRGRNALYVHTWFSLDQRIRSPSVSVGHSYNLMDVRGRRIVNVETASGNRSSVHDAGAAPFFHANMYRHLQVKQVQDENSMSREKRAAQCSVDSKETALSLLGDTADDKYPIFMTGPTLHTLCTVLIDLDEATMTIYRGNPKIGDTALVLPILSN